MAYSTTNIRKFAICYHANKLTMYSNIKPKTIVGFEGVINTKILKKKTLLTSLALLPTVQSTIV